MFGEKRLLITYSEQLPIKHIDNELQNMLDCPCHSQTPKSRMNLKTEHVTEIIGHVQHLAPPQTCKQMSRCCLRLCLRGRFADCTIQKR